MAPRNRQGATTNSRSTNRAALLAITTTLSRETNYRHNLKQIHARNKHLATQLAVDGEMEHALLQGDQGDDQNHNNEDFLNEQRTRLKLLSSNNARRNEEIDKFISAMGNLRDTLNNSNTASQRRSQNGDDEDEDGNEIDDSEPVDYIQIISDKMDDVYSKRRNDNDLEEYYDDEFCKSVRERLGEKSRQKRSRRQSTEDDDIEIMPETFTQANTNTATDEARHLKCPITKLIFEDPVKSKICDHTYDRAGLQQMWKIKKYKCPVPGCGNNNVNQGQLEDDEEMKLKVRSYLRRTERMKEEDAGEDHIGMTVVS